MIILSFLSYSYSCVVVVVLRLFLLLLYVKQTTSTTTNKQTIKQASKQIEKTRKRRLKIDVDGVRGGLVWWNSKVRSNHLNHSATASAECVVSNVGTTSHL